VKLLKLHPLFKNITLTLFIVIKEDKLQNNAKRELQLNASVLTVDSSLSVPQGPKLAEFDK